MKRIIVCGLTLCVLVACNQKEPKQDVLQDAPSATATASRLAAKEIKPVSAPEGERGLDELVASGIEIEFQYSVLYDILDVSDSGKRRHRVLLEVEEGSFEDAVSKLENALMTNGFTRKSGTDQNGRLERVFAKPGASNFYLLMQPAGMGPELKKPESVGSIHIMWNM